MANSSVPITPGTGANIDSFTAPNGDHRQIVMLGDKGGFKGRCGTFRIPGRSVTAQPLFAIHNATGSAVDVDVRKITIDSIRTAASVTVADILVLRLYRFTTLPTGGVAPVKVAEDTTLTSSTSLTLWADAQSDGTVATTALAVTPTTNAIVTQEFASRLYTIVGAEIMDRAEFLAAQDEMVTLNPLEGLVLRAETNTAGHLATAQFVVTCRWEEYTP